MVFTSLLLSIIICVLMIINQWDNKNKTFIYLFAIIIIAGIRQAEFILFNLTNLTNEMAITFIHTNPLTCMLGPLVYYYFRSTIQGKIVLDYYFLIYLIPSFIIFVNSLPYYVLPFNEKLHFALVKQNENSLHISDVPLLLFDLKYQRLTLPLYNWSMLAYSIFYIYKKNKTKALKPKVAKLVYKSIWIATSFVLPFVLVFVNSILNSSSIFNFSFRIAPSSFEFVYYGTLILPISIIFYPELIFGDPKHSLSILERVINHYKNNFKISFEKVEEKTEKTEDLDRILNYIKTNKPCLNNAFSVHDLSRVLNIPQIRISTCFNKQINIPFPTFRNQLRIKHAVQMFREQKHLQMSIEGISKQSGFKTLSAFYAAFRAEYKMTPTEWLEKNL